MLFLPPERIELPAELYKSPVLPLNHGGVMTVLFVTLLDLLQITFQSLGESNPFSLREGQVYYLYTKGPLVKKAKQGIEPCTTDHETVMLPLHYFACQLLF